MAVNLSGMFAGLNNSIMTSADALGATDERVPGMLPRGPQDVMNPMLRAAGAGGAALVNKLPGANVDYRTSLEVAREAEKEVAAMPLNTAAGLAQAANVYGQAGMPEKQMAFRKMAMEKAASEAAAHQQQQQRETMAANARRLGLTSLADELDAGSASLKEASKIISDQETEVLKQTKGIDSHKRVAKVRGVPQAVIDSFGDMTPDERMDIIKGYEGDTKPFVGPDGQSRIYSVVGGKVWDPAQSKYVMPSELNLQPAPVTSRQESVMNYAAKSIAEGKNARFNDAYEMARKAVDSVERNERAQRLVDAGIYTGPLAPFQTFAGKLAASLGMENAATATAAQTEAFLSERAAEIGEVIDMFGSGTGLSDADWSFIASVSLTSQPSRTLKTAFLQALPR